MRLGLMAILCFPLAIPQGQAAGGKWSRTETTSRLSGERTINYTLKSNETIPYLGTQNEPFINIGCSGAGKMKFAAFNPMIPIGMMDGFDAFNAPYKSVRVRIGDKIYSERWDIADQSDFLWIPHSTLHKMLAVQDVRVQFSGISDLYTLTFSPAGIDASGLQRECGIKPKK